MNPAPHTSKPRSTYTLLMVAMALGVFGLLFILSLFECIRAEGEGRACMESLQPAVDLLIKWFRFPRDHTRYFFNVIFLGVGASLILGLAWSAARRRSVSIGVCCAVMIALVGEYLILQKQPTPGAIVTMLSPILIALSFWGLPQAPEDRSPHKLPLRLPEVLGLLLLSVLLFQTQFFSLNRVPYTWDTEFCPFRYIYWPTWEGLLLHESGYHPQTSSGLLWNFFLTALGHVDEPDRYYLYIRFLSSGLAATKFLALFFLVRWMSGTFAAFLSIAILGFGPPENWWSREPFLHQLSGLVAIPLFWSWIAAWRKPTLLRFSLLAFSMILMRFVYPAGMFLAFGPLVFFSLLVVFKRREWLQHAYRMLPMLVGIGFWLTWRSIARGLYTGRWELIHPLEVPGKYVPRGLGMRLAELSSNIVDVFNSTFVYQVNPTHWTVALTLAPERCTTSIVIVLTLLMLGRIVRGRGNAIDLLLIISLAFSFFPGIITEVAARRIGVSFLILTLIAAREATFLTELLKRDGNRWIAGTIRLLLPVVVCLYLTWISTAIHFANPGGVPPQIIRGKMMREELQDDALIVYLTGLANCDSFYSFYEEFKARDCAIGYAPPEYEGSADTQTLIDAPAILPNNWVYQRTEMKKCYEQHKNKEWKKIIYLVTDSSQSEELIEKLRARYPNAPHKLKTEPSATGHIFKLFVLTVER